MKKMKWSLGTLISSWLELAGDLMIILCIASYIQTLATDTLSWWNMFNIFAR